MNETAARRESRFTALVLAGTRPGGDPFAQAMGVPYKALIPVHGEAMLSRVIGALRASAHIGDIAVVGLPANALAADESLRVRHADGAFRMLEGDATPSRSVLGVIDRPDAQFPVLVTTADHPLLTPEIVSFFCTQSLESRCDVTIGLTDAAPVARMFPGVRRTNHRFRDGTYCGCNLFALLTPAARRGPLEWVRVEQHRKKPWRIVMALGPLTLLRFLLGRLALADVIRIASRQLNVNAEAVLLPQPEAGFDVDSEIQLRAVERYFDEVSRRGALR